MGSKRSNRGKSGPSSARFRSRAIALAVAAGILATGTITGWAGQPAYAADYPSWDDVKAARANVADQQAQIKVIEDLLTQLQADADAKDAEAQAAGTAYQQADQAFQEAAFKAGELQDQADTANATAEQSRQQAGQMAAQVARQGGGDLSANLFVNAGDADELLSKLGYASKLTEQSEGLYAKALQEKQTAQAATDQANVATKIREELRAEADAARIAAQAAFDAAQAALADQQTHQADLQAQLAVLQSTAEVTEADYAEGQRVAEEAAAKAKADALAAQQAQYGSSSTIAAGKITASGWAWPAAGILLDGFGYRWHPVYHEYLFHDGQDVAAAAGTPIYAAASGRVVYSGWYGGYGNFIQIDHGNGISTAYGHIQPGGLLVKSGDQVVVGQLIGRVGTTGTSTGNHLHFEVRQNNVAIDPVAFMRGKGVSIG